MGKIIGKGADNQSIHLPAGPLPNHSASTTEVMAGRDDPLFAAVH